MKRFVIPILILCTFCAVAVPQGNNKTARQRTPRTVTYRKPTAAQIEASRKQAAEFARIAKEALKIDLKLIETDHFLIFSTWPEDKNKPLKKAAEDVYKALCKQFGISAKLNIWVGKCPIYIFDKKEDYRGFTEKIGNGQNIDATGYCSYRENGFCYIVMGPCGTDELFHEIFTHEMTHGFINRYLTGRPIPDWVSEGVAEFMASTMVSQSLAEQKCANAEKEVISNGADGSKVFESVELNPFDYGISQSIVRFMVATSGKKFTRFVTLLKQGQPEKEALKETYNCTHEELYEAWLKSIKEKRSRDDAAATRPETAPAENASPETAPAEDKSPAE